MGTPENDTFESKVNAVVSQMTPDDKGNLVLPDGVEADEAVLFAATQIKRQRDTQSAYTKAQQRVKALEAENERLATSWEQDAVSNLSATEQARLEELKTQDPDAWRAEITKLEEDKRKQFSERRQTISQEASQVTELERRASLLDAYNTANPEAPLTDEVIENDLPPRITKKLESGELSFEDFLDEAHKYLHKGKRLAPTDKPNEDPNLGDARGSHRPSAAAAEQQSSSDYKNEIF